MDERVSSDSSGVLSVFSASPVLLTSSGPLGIRRLKEGFVPSFGTRIYRKTLPSAKRRVYVARLNLRVINLTTCEESSPRFSLLRATPFCSRDHLRDFAVR